MKKYLFTILSILIVQYIFAQSWQQIGPSGGYFKEFAIDPTNSSIIYAGSDDGGGIWKTTDNGNSWNLLTADFPNMTGWKIIISETSPNTIYACELYGRYGVLKSTDGGLNWNQISNGLNYSYDKMVSGLVMQNLDTLLISTGESATSTPKRTGNGVFISYNGGDLWSIAGLQGYTIPSIANNAFGTVFAGSESNGLFYTNDNGINWFTHPDIDVNATIHEIDVIDSVIVLGASSGVYLSTNWGMNFSNIGLANNFNFDVAIHKLTPNIEIYSSTFFGLQKYSTSTSAWDIVSGTQFTGQLVIGIATDGINVYAGLFSNSPIVKSLDGGVFWSYLNNNPTATELNDLFIDPLNNNRILTALLGSYNVGGNFNKECIYETNNGGTSWIRKGPQAHALCFTPNPQNSNTFYLGTFSQGLFKTYNSFNTVTNLTTGNKAIGDIAVSTEDTNVVIISEVDLDLYQISIKRSTNGGDSFTNVATLLTNRILFNPNANDTVFAASDNGIYISSDNGVTWNYWMLSGENIYSLAYSNNTLYAGTNQGELYKINNSFASNISGSWQTPVEIKSIYTLNNDIFIGLNGAEKDTICTLHGSIWQTSDDGNSWFEITHQMTSTNIFGNNIIVSDGNELYAGTYGGGIFKSNGLVLSVKEIANEPERNIKIIMFPNPTSDIVYIKSNVEIISDLKVYNIIGQDLTSIVKTTVYNKKAIVDLSNLSTGIYIININETTANNVYKK